MKYCKFCGQELDDNVTYCPTCGGKQDGNEQVQSNYQTSNPSMPTSKSNDKSTMYLVAFIFLVISCLSMGWLIIPLAWLIPMTLATWKAYKGERTIGTGMSVCMLIFANIISGILCLVAEDK